MSQRPDQHLRHAAKRQLDATVIGIELTLISIIQGLALGVLAANAVEPIVALQWEYWPYVVTALLSTLIFWSRSLVHTLSFVGWPLEFGHTFLYFAVTLVEVVAFSQVSDPLNWFALNTVYALAIWWLYAHDLAVIRRHASDFTTPGERALYADLIRDQLSNIRVLMPFAVVFHAAAWALIVAQPQWMLEQKWHVLPAVLSVFAGLHYLYGSVRLLRHRQDWILERAAQERSEG